VGFGFLLIWEEGNSCAAGERAGRGAAVCGGGVFVD
jgi:hypothetical protein